MLVKRATLVLLVIGALVLLARLIGTLDSPAGEGESQDSTECRCAASAGPILPLPGDRDTTFDGVTY